MAQIEENIREKVKRLLRELFQFDNQDLDFGIYRIMNFKRKEIEKFIEQDLIAEAEVQFQESNLLEKADLKNEINNLRAEIVRDFGDSTLDIDGNVKKNADAPKIKLYLERKKALEDFRITQSQINDVFNHMFEFFSRYYDKGDFIPKRRYGYRNKYSVPYNGEEVVLHWATKGMHYVKTGEFFKKYSFRTEKYLITFVLTEAKVDLGNIKGDTKYFILSSDNPVLIDDDRKIVEIRFNYRELLKEEISRIGKSDIQATLAKEIIAKIAPLLNGSPIEKILAVSAEGKSLLEKHLNAYVDRNTKDFFIHKDLAGFLESELDFYIKNEVWDINELSQGNSKLLMAKVAAFRNIAIKVILFLDQIENFQKSLFEKKKYVLKTDYCVTLDLVDPALYTQIISNKDQLNEWQKLLTFDFDKKLIETNSQLSQIGKNAEKRALELLVANPTLTIDTKFFDPKFKSLILNNIDNLDERITGILINSENFQALNLLNWKDKIQFCYIDPPYNTGGDEFLYKDNYQHSSWLSMLYDRLEMAKAILSNDGVIFISIGQDEIDKLIELMDSIFERCNRIGIISRLMKTGGNKGKFFSPNVEYILVYAKSIDSLQPFRENLSEELIEKVYNQIETEGLLKGERYRIMGLYQAYLDIRPNQRYWIKCPDGEYVIPPGSAFPEVISEGKQVEPANNDGVWRWTYQRFKDELAKGNVIFKESTGSSLISSKHRQAKWNIYTKIWLKDRQESGRVPVDIITKYENRHSSAELKDLGIDYSFAKPSNLIKHLMEIQNSSQRYVIDFFAGSGTTGQAVLNLNQEDSGNRKFILVEADNCFQTILKPRILKVIFSRNWKQGKPLDNNGCKKQIIKYQTIEQYEDSLNNIEFTTLDGAIQKTLDTLPDYILSYFLRNETRESPIRLSNERFKTPFSYYIKVLNGGKEKEEVVDVVETFNYLIGIKVETIWTLFDDQRKYQIVKGRLENRRVLIIWRDLTGIDLKRDKEFIENSIIKNESFEIILVNGESYIRNSRPIEPEFKRLMGA